MLLLKQFDGLQIGLEEIEVATNNFSDENAIGRGRFGRVYKGELVSRQPVAVKRLDSAFGQGRIVFWTEVMLLSEYRHENIVSLVGYSHKGREKILVYEYLKHGSLDRYLSDADLTWLTRLRICLDVARGLSYLHNPQGSHHRVVHRDMKSASILLDENWHAKISNFGSSDLGPMKHTFLVSNATGTVGYLDPHYVESGLLTTESDVYSFGVVLFEVLCGRLAVEKDDDGDNGERLLGPFACHHYEEGTIRKIVDPIFIKQMNPESLEAFSAIAYRCLKVEPSERPTMDEVVKALEELLGLQQEFEKALALQKVSYLSFLLHNTCVYFF